MLSIKKFGIVFIDDVPIEGYNYLIGNIIAPTRMRLFNTGDYERYIYDTFDAYRVGDDEYGYLRDNAPMMYNILSVATIFCNEYAYNTIFQKVTWE